MKIALVDVPDDALEAVRACLSEAEKGTGQPPAPPVSEVEWNGEHAANAIEALGDFETRLLWRIADARGARVPLSELVRDLGLPGDAALERDFSGLSRYCVAAGEPRPPLPVIAGGPDDGPWYWMDPFLATIFRAALEDGVFGGSSSGS